MLKFLTAIPNKLLALGALAGLAVIALFCVDFYQNFNQTQGLSEAELLKASKEDIINYQIQNNDNNSNSQGIVVYRYVSNKEAPAETYQGLTEDLSKRTANSQAFLKSIKRIDEKTQQKEYVGRFYAGEKWQKEGEKWYQVETATTTKAAFFRQTELTLLDKAKELLGRKVLADTFPAGEGDGYVYRTYLSDWATMHDATVGYGATPPFFNYTNTSMTCGLRVLSGSATLFRCFVPINTSALPDSANITLASFSIYIASKSDDDNDGDDFITVVQTTQASNTALEAEDYDQCGAVTNPTEGVDSGERKDITSISASAYLAFTFNSTGIGWISKTDYTKLGIREGHDVLNHETGLITTGTNVGVATSESANNPYLEVTYDLLVSDTIRLDGGTIKLDGGTIKLD